MDDTVRKNLNFTREALSKKGLARTTLFIVASVICFLAVNTGWTTIAAIYAGDIGCAAVWGGVTAFYFSLAAGMLFLSRKPKRQGGTPCSSSG